MDLSSLEATFFREILNAELDVPVKATLKYGNDSLEMIVLPQITPSGHFELKYYNAPAAESEGDFNQSDALGKNWGLEEDFGRHPLLQKARSDDGTVSLQLQTSPMPLQHKYNPHLFARVLHAGMEHRGSLALNHSQVVLQESLLTRAKFKLVGFPDFLPLEQQSEPDTKSDDSTLQHLKTAIEGFPRGVRLNLFRARSIVLASDDGWKVSVEKDQTSTRSSVSHTGLIERSNGAAFSSDDLSTLLRGLNYFFAFAACSYCQPTVVIGYDAQGRPVWGQIGRFAADWLPPTNWFNHLGFRKGEALQELFPKFWLKWQEHRDVIVTVIECYVNSHAMRRVGVGKDAVAKSYTGLNLLSSLQQGTVVSGSAHIKKTLRDYTIPKLSTEVVKRISKRLGAAKRQGPELLDRVRGYVAHPLEGGQHVKIKPEALEHLDSDPMEYLHLHDLSQFYLEYMFLAFCGLSFEKHRPLLEDIQ